MVNLCLRVDAGNKIGMGHLIESLSLAESFRKRRCNVIFLTKNNPVAVGIIRKNKYPVEVLPEKITEAKEITSISSFLKKSGIDMLVCDLYGDNTEYFKKIDKISKFSVIILDNGEHKKVAGKVIVNFSILQDGDFYKRISNENNRYLTGPKYMLLPRKASEDWKKKKRILENCKTIFVNQGGSDPFGLTLKIVKALELLELKQKVIVVVGPAVLEKQVSELKKIRKNLKNNYQFEWGIPPGKMHGLMAKSDISITAAGNTLYELALLGVPSITICHHECHNAVAKNFAEQNAVINLGVGTHLDCCTIARAVDALLKSQNKRRKLSRNMKKIVDGLGSERVVEKVLTIWREYS
jgi:UDP-2,4-diacetamido-2,4,6-trideoxy-beta-L-altropyranose hydrolase